MVMFQALHALMNLDLGFFIDAIMNNLLWVFIFFAASKIFVNEKRPLYSFVLLSVYAWIFTTFVGISHFKGFTGDPFFFFAVFGVLILVTDTIPSIQKHKNGIHLVVIYGVLLYFTFFL